MTDSAGTLCILPLCRQAAGNMYVMEWMVGQAAWLPSIAMTIRGGKNYQIFSLLADWKLPETGSAGGKTLGTLAVGMET